MNDLSPTEIGGLVALIGAIGAALGALVKVLMDAWSKYRAEKRQDALATANIDLLEDKQLDDALKYHIKKQDKQITDLTEKSEALSEKLVHCLQEHASEQTRGEFMQRQIDELRRMLSGPAT